MNSTSYDQFVNSITCPDSNYVANNNNNSNNSLCNKDKINEVLNKNKNIKLIFQKAIITEFSPIKINSRMSLTTSLKQSRKQSKDDSRSTSRKNSLYDDKNFS